MDFGTCGDYFENKTNGIINVNSNRVAKPAEK